MKYLQLYLFVFYFLMLKNVSVQNTGGSYVPTGLQNSPSWWRGWASPARRGLRPAPGACSPAPPAAPSPWPLHACCRLAQTSAPLSGSPGEPARQQQCSVMHRHNTKLMLGAQVYQKNAWCWGRLVGQWRPPCNLIQFKNFNYPTRGSFAAVMVG